MITEINQIKDAINGGETNWKAMIFFVPISKLDGFVVLSPAEEELVHTTTNSVPRGLVINILAGVYVRYDNASDEDRVESGLTTLEAFVKDKLLATYMTNYKVLNNQIEYNLDIARGSKVITASFSIFK